jgi:hypothetical protein
MKDNNPNDYTAVVGHCPLPEVEVNWMYSHIQITGC